RVPTLARDKDLFLADEVHILRGFLRDRAEEAAELKREVEWESPLRRNAEIFVRIRDQDERLVAETPDMSRVLAAEVFPPPVEVDAAPGQGSISVANARTFQLVSARAKLKGSDGTVYTLHVAVDRTEEETLLAEHRRHLWLGLAFAFIVCSVGGYWLAHRGIRPVRE